VSFWTTYAWYTGVFICLDQLIAANFQNAIKIIEKPEFLFEGVSCGNVLTAEGRDASIDALLKHRGE